MNRSSFLSHPSRAFLNFRFEKELYCEFYVAQKRQSTFFPAAKIAKLSVGSCFISEHPFLLYSLNRTGCRCQKKKEKKRKKVVCHAKNQSIIYSEGDKEEEASQPFDDRPTSKKNKIWFPHPSSFSLFLVGRNPNWQPGESLIFSARNLPCLTLPKEARLQRAASYEKCLGVLV